MRTASSSSAWFPSFPRFRKCRGVRRGDRLTGRADDRRRCALPRSTKMESGGSQMRSSACRTSVLTITMLFAGCSLAAAQDYAGREKLRAQSNEFRKEVIRVTDGVYVAVGYSASNAILVQGERGSIIVDTSTDPVAARALRTSFGNLLSAPVRAIIYTHSHPDHTGGALVFAGNDKPEIYSHQRLLEAVPDLGRAGRDGGDQFGMALPDSMYTNAGVQMEFGRATPPTP